MMITGMNCGRNCIKNGYPFVESILSKLPLVDEYFVSDGGSNDGTWEVLQRLSDIFPKIQVFHMPDEKNVRWDSCSTASNKFIQVAKGDWIYLDNMDEAIHERDITPLRRRILSENVADVFRYDRKEITHDWSRLTKDIYWPARTARNIPNLYMNWNSYGGDEFLDETGWIRYPPRCQKIPFLIYHFHAVFPGNRIAKRRNDAEWIAPGDMMRVKIYGQIKGGKYGRFTPPTDVYSDLPAITKGLSQMECYRVRDELFDKGWLREVTGLDY